MTTGNMKAEAPEGTVVQAWSFPCALPEEAIPTIHKMLMRISELEQENKRLRGEVEP